MLNGWLAISVFVGEFVVKFTLIIMILIKRGDKKPSAPLTWIVLILAVPILGVLAYLLVGETRFGRKRIARHREIVARVQAPAAISHISRPAYSTELPQTYKPIATLAEAVASNIPHSGNTLKLIGDTDLFIEALVEDIQSAQEHCHLLFYIFLPDHSGKRIAEALIHAAKKGTHCRLLVDSVGSRVFLKSKLKTQMQEAGVHIVGALPANLLRMAFARIDLRNHRKIAVIDGKVAYTGSHNIADAEFLIKKRFGPWVDTTVRIVGPVVRDLQTLFIEDWYLDTDEALDGLLKIQPPVTRDGITIQIMGTGPNSYNDALRQLTQAAFHCAREELILTTPYFVPDEATAIALRTAARQGVETTLIVPARNDSPLVAAASRSFYEKLLDAGVKIYEFNKGLLHAKTMTIDRDLAFLSTANLDRRSFELNFEVSIVVYNSDFASQLRFMQRSYIEDSTQVDAALWRKRPWPKVLVHNAVGMVGPLL